MGNNILKNYKIYRLIIKSLSLTIKDILIGTKYKKIMYGKTHQYNLMINENCNGKKFKIIK